MVVDENDDHRFIENDSRKQNPGSLSFLCIPRTLDFTELGPMISLLYITSAKQS